MPTIRLVRPVNRPSGRGPGNGQYALQKLLRANKPTWLEIGGELQPGDIPWIWSWQDRAIALACHDTGRPFILGPNVLFDDSRRPCHNQEEQTLVSSPWCLLYFTESAWYADLIRTHVVGQNAAPIVVWRYPIDPIPQGPLPVRWDVLIYAKSGYTLETIRHLGSCFSRSTVIEYGSYKRERLLDEARRSAACIYLSDDDRGPLALAEILLTGCPAVGVPHGAPWIVNGVNGFLVDDLDGEAVTQKIVDCAAFDRQAVREYAIRRFDGTDALATIIRALAPYGEVNCDLRPAFAGG